MTTDRIPAALRDRIAADLEPVRPLPPVWRRTLVVALVAAAVFTLAIAVYGLRRDLLELPMWITWGGAILQLGTGIVLAGLALRESVPGAGIPAGALAAAVATGLGVQILVGISAWLWTGMPRGMGFSTIGSHCMTDDLKFAVPIAAVALWLVFRALPLRAPAAGALGGTGAALVSDAIAHMRCPAADPHHVLVWHLGAVLILAGAGWLVGWVWSRVRWASLRTPTN